MIGAMPTGPNLAELAMTAVGVGSGGCGCMSSNSPGTARPGSRAVQPCCGGPAGPCCWCRVAVGAVENAKLSCQAHGLGNDGRRAVVGVTSVHCMSSAPLHHHQSLTVLLS